MSCVCRTTWFVFSFSFYHCYFHSFPTRRSSDLGARRSPRHPLVAFGGAGGRACPHPALAEAAGRHAARGRSEEHTSELQSRGHLVCRLLLEKKNIYAHAYVAIQ